MHEHRGLEIRIGVLSRDTTKWGKAKAAQNIVGSELYRFQGSNCPTLYDPSFVKTFRTRRGGVDVVHVYREEASRSDVLAVHWTEDIKMASAICARRTWGRISAARPGVPAAFGGRRPIIFRRWARGVLCPRKSGQPPGFAGNA